MKTPQKPHSPSAGGISRNSLDNDLGLIVWAGKKLADENETVLNDVHIDTKITPEEERRLKQQLKEGSAVHPPGGIPLAQNLDSFYEIEFVKKSPEQLAEQRPFEHIRTAIAIEVTFGAPLPLSYGYKVPERSRIMFNGHWFEEALAPYYPDEVIPETRQKSLDPLIPGNSEVFTNMTKRDGYYLWDADMGALKQNFEDVRELLDGNFWVDLGAHNGKKLRAVWEIGKAYEKETGKPFAPAMHAINDITSLDPAHKELLAAGIAADKILELPGDFESRKFWQETYAAYQVACEKTIARGEVRPKLVITELGGTAGNRGPEGLKQQLRAIRRGLPCAYTYVASIDGTGTDLRPEDCADPDSKDLHGKTPEEIKHMEAQGRVALQAAYDIPETKHFAHMNVFNLFFMNRLINDPRDLTAEIRFDYPQPGESNLSAVQFVVTNHDEKKRKITLPDVIGKLSWVIKDGLKFFHEPLSKMGRSYTKNLFKEAKAEVVKRLGYIDDGRYPGVNHGLYTASYPDRSLMPQLSPAGRSSAPAYQG